MLIGILSLGLGWLTPAGAAPPLTGLIKGAAVAPTGPAMAFNAAGAVSNGAIGFVFPVPASADGKPYSLTKTTTAFGNVDVWFYTDNAGKIGDICSPVVTSEDGTVLNSSTETGVICPGSQTAAWAVVVLFSGANLSFSLSF
jgi:hypothetical protein